MDKRTIVWDEEEATGFNRGVKPGSWIGYGEKPIRGQTGPTPYDEFMTGNGFQLKGSSFLGNLRYVKGKETVSWGDVPESIGGVKALDEFMRSRKYGAAISQGQEKDYQEYMERTGYVLITDPNDETRKWWRLKGTNKNKFDIPWGSLPEGAADTWMDRLTTYRKTGVDHSPDKKYSRTILGVGR